MYGEIDRKKKEKEMIRVVLMKEIIRVCETYHVIQVLSLTWGLSHWQQKIEYFRMRVIVISLYLLSLSFNVKKIKK